MANVNEVFLMGNLSRDPKVNRTASGTSVANLSLALERKYEGKDGQEKKDVCFVDVTVWGKSSEWCADNLKKGSRVHVKGYLQQQSWDDKTTGEKRSKIVVQAERIQSLDRKEKANG